MDFIDSSPDWPYSRAKTTVLRAAASVIRESGPRAATLKNIAQKAGITEPAIFRHFDGVDGLFEGLFFVFENHFSRITASFNRPQKGLDRVLGATQSSLELFGQNKDFAYLALHAEHVFRGYDSMKKRVNELRDEDNAAAESAFVEAADMGQLRKGLVPRLAAVTIMSTLFFTVQSWVESELDIDIVGQAFGRVNDLVTMFRIF
ncbi:MAG: TetR/AcrR family transcriptional regulator [Treponema sp.]|nr:TetR/AcrR family transcriptional regulator [Treponema sp.]